MVLFALVLISQLIRSNNGWLGASVYFCPSCGFVVGYQALNDHETSIKS